LGSISTLNITHVKASYILVVRKLISLIEYINFEVLLDGSTTVLHKLGVCSYWLKSLLDIFLCSSTNYRLFWFNLSFSNVRYSL